jgi:hypothetical protein
MLVKKIPRDRGNYPESDGKTSERKLHIYPSVVDGSVLIC